MKDAIGKASDRPSGRPNTIESHQHKRYRQKQAARRPAARRPVRLERKARSRQKHRTNASTRDDALLQLRRL